MLSEMATFEYMENITIMADKLAAYAAASGYKTALKHLLVTRHVMAGGLTAARDDEGTPLLGLAVRGGHAECVKLLLKHGADPNATSRTLGAPPLALACVHGAEGCIAQLVKARQTNCVCGAVARHCSGLYVATTVVVRRPSWTRAALSTSSCHFGATLTS